jgi:hypothetical protein
MRRLGHLGLRKDPNERPAKKGFQLFPTEYILRSCYVSPAPAG